MTNITRNYIRQVSETLAGNARTRYFDIYDTDIEDQLGTFVQDYERAKLGSIKCKASVRYSSTTARLVQAFLIMAAASAGTFSETSDDTDHATVEAALDATMSDEYAFQILDHTVLKPVTMTATDAPAYIYVCEGTLNCNYKPPKGDSGLFVSDEQLDEDQMRSNLFILIKVDQGVNGDIIQVVSWSKFTAQVSPRSLKLAEV